MYIALQSVFNLEIVKHIHSFRVKREVVWEEVESSRLIYETKRITTREWHGRGAFVFSIRSEKPGWYRWIQLADDAEPTYRFVEGAVAVSWNGDIEYMAVLLDDFEESEVDADDDSSAFFHIE